MNTQPYNSTHNGINLWKDTDEPRRNTVLESRIIAARQRMGQHQIDEDVYTMAKTETQKLINDQYSYLSIHEINEILFLGSQGELGDTIAISSKAIYRWFKNYFKDYRPKVIAQWREEEKMNVKALPEPEKKELSREEVIRLAKELITDFKHTQAILFPINYYDILEKYGLLSFTVDEKKEYWEQAKEQAVIEAMNKKSNGRINSFQFEAAVLGRDENMLERHAKRLALIDWIENEPDLG